MLEGKRFSGERIRQARFDCGMTQAQLARAAGTRERNIVRWEREQNQPRLENVLAIAEATGKPLDFFVVEANPSDDPMTREQALRNVGLAVEQLLAVQT